MGWEGEEGEEGEKEREVMRREGILVVRICEVPDCTHVFMFLNVPRMYVLGQCRTWWGECE